MAKLIIEEGQRFNFLTIIRETERLVLPSGQTNRAFLCKCDCGNEKVIRLLHFVRGRIKTCRRCDYLHVSSEHKRLYRIWVGMKSRCKQYHSEPHLYYDKGIKVGEYFLDFNRFMDWSIKNGYSDELQIDRIDGNKGYHPENCRWVTAMINCNNRFNTTMIEYDGEIVSFSLLLHQKGIHENYYTIRARIKRGMNAQQAIDKPIRQGNYSKTNFKRTP